MEEYIKVGDKICWDWGYSNHDFYIIDDIRLNVNHKRCELKISNTPIYLSIDALIEKNLRKYTD